MKAARWFGIIYLSFLLWLLLFPPWVELQRTYLYGDEDRHASTVAHALGHHWRFSIPFRWEWSQGDQQSYFLPNLAARIDYRQMLYEAVTGLVALALLFLLLSVVKMPLRKMTVYAKVEIILIWARVRNWCRRVLPLPAKAVVPLCATYLLAASYLVVRVPTPQSAGGMPPWEEAAKQSSGGTMLLHEAALFLLTVTVYFGLVSLFRRRQRTQAGGKKSGL